jgi:hypothetical protein
MSRQCTSDEVRAFLQYQLARSNTKDFVLSAVRETGLERSEVVGVPAIGRLLTFFQNIGRARSTEVTGQRYFTVRAAAALQQDPVFAADPEVAALRDCVEKYVSLFDSPSSNPWVTVVACSDAEWLVDGNKTTIAAFRFAQARVDSPFALPVYRLPFPDMTLERLTGEACKR